jgi:predicted MFS family arabinose efflux permease
VGLRGLIQRMHGQVLILAIAQALVQTASTLVATVGALAGAEIAPAPGLATAPIAAMFLGTTMATIPASLWMAARGRRVGFVAGALAGALGGLVAAAGIALHSLLVFSLGTLLVGAYQGTAQFYRFAASEVADDAFRARAISLVLAGGVAAALLGPALGRFGAPWLRPMYAGSFLLLAVTSLAAAGLLLGVRVPLPKRDDGAGGARSLPVILRQPSYAVAVFAAATGAGVMVLAMTATPLAMRHDHHGLDRTALVIQLHVLGMFLPSFFTGSLIARWGVLRIMAVGLLLLAGHVTLSLVDPGLVSFAAALVLLGVGWNFLYVGGTTLLTGSYTPAERGRAQAANDLIIYLVGLLSSLAAGPLLGAFGWRVMNALLLPWLLAVAIALAWLGRARGQSLRRAVGRGHGAPTRRPP